MGATETIDRDTELSGPLHQGNVIGLMELRDTFSPEPCLAAACCLWPPSELRNAAVNAAAINITDWDSFLRVVKRHRVAGLSYNALSSAGITLPRAAAAQLELGARQIAQQNIILAAESVRLQRLFDAANIATLILKGVALAQLAYGSLSLKHARDIDLLVVPECAEAAMQLLEREGYALTYPPGPLRPTQLQAVLRYAREVQFSHRDKKLLLELQWGGTPNPFLLRDVNAHSPARTVFLSDGLGIRTLAEDDLFAYLCAHGAGHGWSRLKWLADLNALIARKPAAIERWYRHAQDIGAGLCAGQALLLCHRIFALPLPADLESEFRSSARLRKLASIAVRAIADPYAEAEGDRGVVDDTRIALGQFLLGRGWAFFKAQCRAASFRMFDVVELPLPPALHFLYPPLRLPLWLWRSVGGLLRSAKILNETKAK